jgi:hypothetical protein
VSRLSTLFSGRRLGPRGTAGLALAGLGAAAIVASALILRRTYGGDPAIYLPYARNFAHGHFFEYTRGEFSSGSTSPLWAAILALPYLAGAGAVGAKAVAALFTLGAFVLSVAAAHRAGGLLGAAVGGLYVAIVLTVDGLVMYESSLIVGLVALSVLAGQRVQDAIARGERLGVPALWPLVVVWAALPVARPDAVVLVALELVALLLWGRRAGRRDLGALVAGAAVASVPSLAYYGYSLAKLGVPSTSMQGRAFQFHELAHHRLGPLYLSDGAVRYVVSRPVIWGVGIAVLGTVLLARNGAQRWLAMYAGGGVVLYLALLTFVTPGSYDTGRYLLPAAPLVAVAAARAAGDLARRWLTAPLLVLVAVLLGVAAVRVPIDDSRALQRAPYDLATIAHKDAADYVNRVARPGDSVLAYEVQVRYFLREDVRVLSLDGITDGKVAPYAKRGDLRSFLLRHRPRWWILDTSTDPPHGGVGGRPYLVHSLLGTAARRLIDHPRLRTTTVGGIRFAVAMRRAGALPYRFGAWRMVVRLAYPPPRS